MSRAQDTSTPSSVEVPATQAAVDNPLANTVERPRWELGIGSLYVMGHDYPASKDVNPRAIFLPYFVYRSPRIRAGGGGLRAVAIERPRLKLDLSVSGSLNARSTETNARQGMPDLDFLFELGPQLGVQLIDEELSFGGRLRGQFNSKLRAVFSSDFKGVDTRGFVAEFGVAMSIENIRGTGIRLTTGFDATFASDKLQDYFYEVSDQYVTSTRAQYDAKGGYLGSVLYAGMSFKPFSQLRLFAGANAGFFNGAANQDSPLFEVTEQLNFALGLIWTIKTSKDMVEIVELSAEAD